jgi:hypothetical protein
MEKEYTTNRSHRISSKQTNNDYITTPIIILVLLSGVYFFRIAFFSLNIIYILQFATIGLLVLIILFQNIYWKFNLNKHHFTWPVLFIFTGMFLSMLTAEYAHNQPIVISLWAQRFLYFYLFYFVLHIFQPSVKTLENILIYAGIAYILAFLLQYIAFPRVIFDVRQEIDRGTIRIFLPGLLILYTAYFICLTRVLFFNSFKYIFFIIPALGIIILSGTRSIIAAPVIVTFLVLIFSKKIKSRALILILVLATLGMAYYMFQDIIENLLAISQTQSGSYNENIRIRAAKFYLSDFYPNDLAYITGNGQGHQASPYGREIQSYKTNLGYYQSDIGIIGEYTKYGAFFIFGVFAILLKGIGQKLNINVKYVHYTLILILISIPLGMFFTTPDGIVIVCIMMYILDSKRNRRKQTDKKARPIVYFPELENK